MAKPCPNQGTLSLAQTWNASSSNKLLLLETERALAKKSKSEAFIELPLKSQPQMVLWWMGIDKIVQYC